MDYTEFNFWYKNFDITIVDIPNKILDIKLKHLIIPKTQSFFNPYLSKPNDLTKVQGSLNDNNFMIHLYELLELDVELTLDFINNIYSYIVIEYTKVPVCSRYDIIGLKDQTHYEKMCALIRHTGYQIEPGFINYFITEPEPDFEDLDELPMPPIQPLLQRWNNYYHGIYDINNYDDVKTLIVLFSERRLTLEEVENLARKFNLWDRIKILFLIHSRDNNRDISRLPHDVVRHMSKFL